MSVQADMGMGEMVVGPGQICTPAEAADLIDNATKIVSAAEAIGMQKEEQVIPDQPKILSPSKYKSVVSHNRVICKCQLCPLGETRTKFVYGVGNPDADIMFVGEAPGADEDRLGEPFVGRAGKLLDKILVAMELSREVVYIANILKCRPPANRDPQPDEMEKCMPYLREQIRLVKPKILCALGRIAAQGLLDTKTPLGKLRNQWHAFEGVPLMVTYHPAALLRFASYKKDTWADMQMLLARYKEMK